MRCNSYEYERKLQPDKIQKGNQGGCNSYEYERKLQQLLHWKFIVG